MSGGCRFCPTSDMLLPITSVTSVVRAKQTQGALDPPSLAIESSVKAEARKKMFEALGTSTLKAEGAWSTVCIHAC